MDGAEPRVRFQNIFVGGQLGIIFVQEPDLFKKKLHGKYLRNISFSLLVHFQTIGGI
jgi:hypothetical protein